MPAVNRSRLTLAIVATLAASSFLPVFAQDAATDPAAQATPEAAPALTEAAAPAPAVVEPTVAQSAAGQQATTLDRISVTGSRVLGRSAEDTAAPVDIITAEEISSTGAMEVGQILQMVAPSVNFSRTFVSDGTDILRPATLRALGPDQVLVLVNGKRRHQQALVNVQQTIGRGSAGTDVNAIPTSSIERIEVLRDGAAAQYGSDAIAGVINIILKKQTEHTELMVYGSQYYAGDGEQLHGSVNTGFKLGEEGYVNFSLEARNRNETNRAGPDTLRTGDALGVRVTQRLGDADAKDKYLWMNGAMPMGGGELYWFGGLSEREGNSSGFFRSAGDNRTVPALYPNGFLPTLLTTVEDSSIAVGFKRPISDAWDFDFSVNHGRSNFRFDEANSVNTSWWYEPNGTGGIYADSPTSAYTGTLEFDQTTVNLDFRGSVDGFGSNPLYLASGLEWRQEGYAIEAGDPVSYTYGRTNNPAVIIRGQTGDIASPGIQGFPGFTPGTEVDEGRHSMAAYLDAETNLTDRFLMGAAVRFEDYSDFGNTAIGKLSGRFDATEQFAIRASVSNGFRAPGVQQQFYSQVSTNLDPSTNTLVEVLTARQDSAVTRALGVPALKEETSKNASIGVVIKPSDNFSITADIFRIDIEDRIIFSGLIAPETTGTNGQPCDATNSNCPIRAALEPFRVGQAQFFTNAIDTSTQGIDIVANHVTDFASGSSLALTALVHFNKTEVKDIRSESPILSESMLFDPTQVVLVEEGQPRAHHSLQAVYNTGPWQITGRGNYYGSVSGNGFTPDFKQTWSGKTLFDLAVRYALTESMDLTVGGTNIFDTYPDKWDPNGAAPFPQLGFKYGWETMPFGMNGGNYYVKFDYRF